MEETTTVEVTVLDIAPIGKGRVLALASIELTLDGVAFVLHGVEVIRTRHPLTEKNR